MNSADRIDVGEHNLGDLARAQLERARRDPRLDRGAGAIGADFWRALEEAEEARALGILGLHEIKSAFGREQDRLERSDRVGYQAAAHLQSLWERSEMAEASLEAECPALNGQALVAMHSALDALVEEFVPSVRDLQVEGLIKEAMSYADSEAPEAAKRLTPELRAEIEAVFRRKIDLPAARTRPKGSGVGRYEALLEQIGFAAHDDRPLPDDLDQALVEINALRDVLVHRMGRIDQRALKQAPSLPYRDGQLVRIDRQAYRTYSAAIRCYGTEVIHRPMRAWGPKAAEQLGPDLPNWRAYAAVGT